MTARAGIVVTGTEVLTGRVTDRNGPWLADRLLELGVELADTVIVGDRPEDVLASLRFLAGQGCDLVVTSGGLGPTEDDLTAEVVGRFQRREMVLDEALEERIAEILRPLLERWPDLDPEAVREANRKQAVVPAGATVLEPVGTAPGLVVPPPDGEDRTDRAGAARSAARAAADVGDRARDRCLPHRRRGGGDLSPGDAAALRDPRVGDRRDAARRARGGRGARPPGDHDLPAPRRDRDRHALRAEDAEAYEAFAAVVRDRHADTLFSDDGRTIDEQVADLLAAARETIAVAESCTGGLLAARLTERPGSSSDVLGGFVVYSNEAKIELAGVDPALIEAHGAVSGEVADALADGARERLGADVGVGVTGIAGPDGGTEDKPVGLVWFSVAIATAGA